MTENLQATVPQTEDVPPHAVLQDDLEKAACGLLRAIETIAGVFEWSPLQMTLAIAATPPPAADPRGLQSALMRLASRVARLSISIRDPSRFADRAIEDSKRVAAAGAAGRE